MRNLQIKDLIDIVVSDVPEPENRIEKIYEWHFDRVKNYSQWIIGFAATLSIAFIASVFNANVSMPLWAIFTISFLIFGSVTFGIYSLWQLRSLHKQYLASLRLYAELKKFKSFIIRYREMI
jgi:hypothetical protein